MKVPGPISSSKFPTLAGWLNQLRDAVEANQFKPGPQYRLNRTTKGTSLDIKPSAGGSAAATILPFQVYQSDTLRVSVQGGTVIYHNDDFQIASLRDATSDSPPGANTSIAIPINSTNFKIWIRMDDELNPPPTISITSGASGWSGYPNQPNVPARRYMLLAEVDSDATSITDITLNWHGGDIVWPSIYGFWS